MIYEKQMFSTKMWKTLAKIISECSFSFCLFNLFNVKWNRTWSDKFKTFINMTDKIKLNTKQKRAILQILLVLQSLTTKNSDRVLKRYKFRQDMSSSQLIWQVWWQMRLGGSQANASSTCSALGRRHYYRSGALLACSGLAKTSAGMMI